MRGFTEINNDLKDLPITWYPALLKTLVEAAIAKKTFVPGGVTTFVEKVENRISLGDQFKAAGNRSNETDRTVKHLITSLPVIHDGPITREEVIETLYELRDLAYKYEKSLDPCFVRCPDLETVLLHIAQNGLGPPNTTMPTGGSSD